jgi:hypothetical protein
MPHDFPDLIPARFLQSIKTACLTNPLVRFGRGPVALNDWTPYFFRLSCCPRTGSG